MKKCIKCDVTRPTNEFHIHPGYADGRKTKCKQCCNLRLKERRKSNPELFKAKSKEYYKNNVLKMRKYATKFRLADPDRYKGYRLKESFGLSMDDYKSMLSAQNGCCAICNTHQKFLTKRLAVDHCHESNMIRGLLCGNCNTALGRFKDNPDYLLAAHSYLTTTRFIKKELV